MATSKRASANTSESEMKRAKLDECVAEYEVVLGGEVYVNVDELFKCAELQRFFIKNYKNSIKGFIKTEGLKAVIVTKDNVKNEVLVEKDTYGSKSDVRLVEKNERIMRIIASAKESSYPLAPPVIKDKDLTFFKDEHGKSYDVEMRGKRTMEGIYIKAKHVGVVFESKNFVDTMLRADSTYHESIDYVWFALQNSSGVRDLKSKGSDTSKQGHHRKSDIRLQEQDHHLQEPKQTYNKKQGVFLTFSGLMHAFHIARSPVAEQFRVWVYQQVFALNLGTVEQKKELLATLCKIDKSFLQAFMKLVPNDLACIYLIDTSKRDGDATVYKFGRSGKIKDRFFDHQFTYGDGTLLDTVIFVPVNALSEAETILKHSVTNEIRFCFDKTTELVTLNNANRKAVRTIMQTIADKYNGSMTIQASKHAEEIKDLKNAYELRVRDLECGIAVFKKQMEMVTERLENQKENEKLRLENAQLRADAKDRQLEEKDERIRRLEETVRVLSKRRSEFEYHP